jgi:hypothetical protein
MNKYVDIKFFTPIDAFDTAPAGMVVYNIE